METLHDMNDQDIEQIKVREMTYSRTRLRLPLLAIGILALTACESTTEPEEDHAEEVEGVMLVLNGQTVASYDGEEGSWEGELSVEAGQQTARISVTFVDHEGGQAELEEDHFLEVDVADESIAAFEQATPGEFAGQLRGQAEGGTEITFMLMHGEVGAGHPDFVTEPLPIRVRN